MRIGIVNDTVIAVEALRRTLLHAAGHEVAWVARDGIEAVNRCAQDVPDLVLMDLLMPRMDGVEATRQIMARSPCAVVVATASVNRNSSKVFAAMGAGALDALDIPPLQNAHAPAEAAQFLRRIHTIDRLIRSTGVLKRMPEKADISVVPRLIAIGASAGGPAALAAVLGRLPADFPVPIIVVQHVEARFLGTLAATIQRQIKLPVRMAPEGEIPASGVVLLADSQNHLVVNRRNHLRYSDRPHDTAYRPSIDVFFHSLCHRPTLNIIAVLLTGMGRDGADGLRALRNAGHYTIVQDEATSAIFGMPKAALELDAAREVLPLSQIGPRLAALVSSECSS